MRPAVVVVDDRERLAPVALPAEQPVAQLVGDRRRARADRLEPLDDALPWRRPWRARRARRSSFVECHADAVAGVGLRPLVGRRVGGEPAVAQPGVGRLHDADDREVELVRELEVALVVRGHRHDRAGAVAHEHVVGDEDRDVPAVGGVLGERAGEDAGLLLALGLALELRLLRRELAVRRDRLRRQACRGRRCPATRTASPAGHWSGTIASTSGCSGASTM